MLPTTIAKNLSARQRNCLIAHVPSPQPFFAITDADSNGLHKTKMLLIERELLCPTTNSIRPKELRLTQLGREVVCHVLGEYADFLVAAGCLDSLTQKQLFENITKASHRRPECDITICPVDATPTDTHARTILREKAGTNKLLALLQAGS